MAIRGKPPTPGVKVGAWRFDNVPQDATRNGWLAGPVHALVCHPSRATKPCARVLIGGNAECAGCEKKHRAEWLGWVPVKRDDGRPLVVCIHESQFWAVDVIKPGSRIVWGRNKGEAEGVWIKQGPEKPTWRSFYPDERPHHFIADYLVLKLWKMPELYKPICELWGEECQRAVTEEIPATPAPAVVVSAPEQPVNRVANAIPAATALDDAIGSLTRKAARMKTAEKNGHAKQD